MGRVMTTTQTMLAPSTAVSRSMRSETRVISGCTQGMSTSQTTKMMASFCVWGGGVVGVGVRVSEPSQDDRHL